MKKVKIKNLIFLYVFNMYIHFNQENIQKIGNELYTQQLEQIKVQMAQFKEQLEIFAKKYKNDIKKDETFRQNFQSMCTSIGVDPLACMYLLIYIFNFIDYVTYIFFFKYIIVIELYYKIIYF